MVKRAKNQNHTCTIHRNTTNAFIPLGSNIQFSTNTEKEQVIIKKTCNNEQISFKINLKTANDKKKLIAIINLSL